MPAKAKSQGKPPAASDTAGEKMTGLDKTDVAKIAEKVYRLMQRELLIERERGR